MVKTLKNIKQVIEKLQQSGIKCIVITVGPRQVAKVVCDIWGFDGYYGSDYEVVEGFFTGEIKKYICADEKITCLKDFCRSNSILPEECIAVGDGSTDIPVFEYCSKSIAINSSEKVKKGQLMLLIRMIWQIFLNILFEVQTDNIMFSVGGFYERASPKK